MKVGVIAGDGVGPEVTAEAAKVLRATGVELELVELPWGSAYWHEHGAMMPGDGVAVARGFDAILLGAVGHPSVPDDVTLWGLLLALRKGLDLLANVRPVQLLPGVPCPPAGSGPDAVDMLFVRENVEGEYSGRADAWAIARRDIRLRVPESSASCAMRSSRLVHGGSC